MVNIANLEKRAVIIAAIRRFFDGLGFIEVTTPVRIAAPAPEPHIDCPVVQPPISDLQPSTFNLQPSTYLRASPELQMKKLLAAGMDRIYQIGPCFRDGELGTRHNPEFTMIEWYRRNADYRDIAADLESLIKSLSEQSNNSFARITVREAYLKYAGWDPWTDWDQDRFDFDMATKIEPNLPKTPVFLTDYPPQASSLAKLSQTPASNLQPSTFNLQPSTSSTIAERWEFYWQGMELANCFTELCDEKEQRERFAAAKTERIALGESDYPLDEEFLTVLPRIESASGVALGVDRLVAILCGERDIHSVMSAQ